MTLSRPQLRLALSATCLLGGCDDSGQARSTFDLSAAGTAPETITVGDWDVTVREARLAFGPVYLCSAQNAGLESCVQAAAEHLGAGSFDALSDTPAPMGTMTGTTGVTVLSGMWDYGRAWRLSEVEPRPLVGAVDGEHSAVVLIEAEVPRLRGEVEVPIVVEKSPLAETSNPAGGVTVTAVPSNAAPVTVKFLVEDGVP